MASVERLQISREQYATAEALSAIELMELPPDNELFSSGSFSVHEVGRMALVRAGWGTYLPTQEIISRLDTRGLLSGEVRAQIEGLGFEGGYRFSPEVHMYSDETQYFQAKIAYQLALKAMEVKGWGEIDGLYVGSSTLGWRGVDQVGRMVREGGHGKPWVQQHSLACQSWTTALVDALVNPNMQGKRVVIVGMDTLTGDIANPYDPITYATFGNGGGALALVPGEDMIYISGMTKVEYDNERITTATLFALPEGVESLPENSLYTLVGENTQDNFHVTPAGVYLDVPSREDTQLIWMNGRGTFAYFVIKGGAPELVMEQIGAYLEHGLAEFGPLGESFGHQPSMAVINGLNKRLERLGRSRGLAVDKLRFRWVMGETGFNNVSAGTGLVAMPEFELGGTHIMLGLGVGSSIGAHVVRINR